MKKNFLMILAACLISGAASTQTSTLNRPFDPVAVSGNVLSPYFGASPSRMVGFRYVNGAWWQIPLQIDEKAVLDIVTPYGPYAANQGFPPPTGVNELFYTDAGTFTGPDTNALFDADDELVFMAKDAGGKYSGTVYPTGTISGTGRELTITDPLGGMGYIYLFLQDGSLVQNAGVNYVTYDFKLANGGTYPQNFVFLKARNDENTTVTTANYSWHFAAEWISDHLKIKTGGAANTDILDRHKAFFNNTQCIRSENTFSDGDNAFVTNKTGPIRAIRSYMGANSGPLTQRTHLFYEARQDIITSLRVHNISSVYDAFDYDANSIGMRYSNNLNTAGVIINGSKDVVALGDIAWEFVSGSKGSLVILHRRSTNLKTSEATFTSYYDDNKSKPASNCTGDGQAWGTSGTGILFQSGSVCTDPLSSGCGAQSQWFRKLASTRIIYFEAPNATTNTATNYNNQLNSPLLVNVNALTEPAIIAGAVVQAVNLQDHNAINEEQTNSVYKMKIHPNPAKESCTVSCFSEKSYRTDLMVFDILGKVALKKNILITKGVNSLKLETNTFAPGLYFIQLINSGKPNIEKLVVQ